jgi:hypothetical protein
MGSYCRYEDCKDRANYKHPNIKGAPKYCKNHIPEGYEQVSVRICLYTGCKKQATFGFANTGLTEYCFTHKLVGQTDVKNKKCIYENCQRQPTYGLPDSKYAIHCNEHKTEGEVDKKHKKCQYPGCGDRPSYGKAGTKKAIYCLAHKGGDDVNVVHKKCIFKGCTTMPTYGLPGTKKVLYCNRHKTDKHTVINTTKQCIQDNCTTTATYGLPGTKKVLYCVKHKLDGNVRVATKFCEYENCEKTPIYGLPKTKKAIYCFTHKDKNHVNIRDKFCIHKECEKQASFGSPDTKKALYCKKHKSDEDIDVAHLKDLCKHEECGSRKYYGIPGYSPEYCEKHKLPNMVPNPTKIKGVNYKTCEYCAYKIHPKQDYCDGCKVYIETKKTEKRKNKELAVKSVLEANSITFTHDLTVKDGCSKKRPDFIITTNWGLIILEVDEFQHNRVSYTEECEIVRMKQLYFDCGVENLLFIRYNPDSYKTTSDKPIINKQREDLLVRYIKNNTTNINNFTGLGVIYLYYDGFTETCLEIERLDPYDIPSSSRDIEHSENHSELTILIPDETEDNIAEMRKYIKLAREEIPKQIQLRQDRDKQITQLIKDLEAVVEMIKSKFTLIP